MLLNFALHQKSGQPERAKGGPGEALSDIGRDEAGLAQHETKGLGRNDLLLQVVERENMVKAWKHVKANRGSAGVDGLTIEATIEYLKAEWARRRDELLTGIYWPKPVRWVAIPKPGGDKRDLGIPTVIDRLIQQALLQILQPFIDPTFSKSSYGFRPGRRAQDAVLQAQRYVQEGYRVVVDIDLERFFDRVNHDVLMDRLSKRINDKVVLRLIRRYLEAGIMAQGVTKERHEGTPQGGPLSPLLANVLLDEVDQELEKRGHKFVRYADDCNVYVRSQRAGADGNAEALRSTSFESERKQNGSDACLWQEVSGLPLLARARRGDKTRRSLQSDCHFQEAHSADYMPNVRAQSE